MSGSNSDVGINLVARTDEFEARLKKAAGSFDTFMQKGFEVSKSIDGSFKLIKSAGDKTATDLERRFNAMHIDSDISLRQQAILMIANSQIIEQNFSKLVTSAKLSAREMELAWSAANAQQALVMAQPNQAKFGALGIKSQAMIEAEILAERRKYAEINLLANISENDRVRAHEAMVAKIAQLNDLLVTRAQRDEAAITRAHSEALAMNAKMSENLGNSIKSNTEGMNLFGLASIGAILKIQILYSLVNSVMSAIGSAPGIAVDAVESFRAAATANAAMITSMQVGVKDVGKAYQENLTYAMAVQDVLVKMDAQTAASANQLSLMNREFVAQGVLIDTNNEKQITGFRNIANALAALTSGDQNKDQQYSQESKALLKGEFRPGDRLSNLVNNLDNGKLKEHLELWKKEGTVIEHIGDLLKGFEAAQGDINALWETAKSTLTTIRDSILRDGFGPEFDFLVQKMRELGEYATENKEKIVAMMQEGFRELNTVAGNIGDIVKAFGKLGAPGLWLGIGAGLMSLLPPLDKIVSRVSMMSMGLNLVGAAAIGLTAAGVQKQIEDKGIDERAKSIRESTAGEAMFGTIQQLDRDSLKSILAKYPLATDEQIKTWFATGAAKVIAETVSSPNGGISTIMPNPNASGGFRNIAVLNDTQIGIGNSENKGVKQPKGLVTSADDQKKIDAKLSLEQSYREKLAALVKSFDDIAIQYAKNNNQVELELLKGKYDASLISQQFYLSERQKEELSANKEELINAKTSLDALVKASKGSFPSGIKGDIERVDAQLKINAAQKTYNALLDQGTLLRVKFANENADFDKKELDFLKGKQAAYADSIGDFITGEQIRRTQLAYTSERKRLLDDGNLQALAAFDYANDEIYRKEEDRLLELQAAHQDSIGNFVEGERLRQSELSKSVEETKLLMDYWEGLKGSKEALNAFYANNRQATGVASDKEWQNNFALTRGAASNEMNAIGGGSFVKQGFDIESEKMIEDQRIKTKYDYLVQEAQMKGTFAAEELQMNERMNREKANADALYHDKKLAMEFDVANGVIGIVKQAAGQNKAIMLAMLAVESAIAIAKIMKAAAVAEMEAMQYGPAAPAVMAGIASTEAMAIAQVVASSAISGMQMQGRENGGPVEAGKSYIVGEKRPELFTPGASGVITPYVPGSGGVEIHQNFSITGVGADIMENIKIAANRAKEAAKSEILNSMNRGGSFALAGGRIK